mmetsp:Transcript_30969/g.61057  ORF Transcript_30969/g.61057 Transcript_30969/m.61057 type:complete len:271 (-) Transcript_30969:1648-2460(-)
MARKTRALWYLVCWSFDMLGGQVKTLEGDANECWMSSSRIRSLPGRVKRPGFFFFSFTPSSGASISPPLSFSSSTESCMCTSRLAPPLPPILPPVDFALCSFLLLLSLSLASASSRTLCFFSSTALASSPCRRQSISDKTRKVSRSSKNCLSLISTASARRVAASFRRTHLNSPGCAGIESFSRSRCWRHSGTSVCLLLQAFLFFCASPPTVPLFLGDAGGDRGEEGPVTPPAAVSISTGPSPSPASSPGGGTKSFSDVIRGCDTVSIYL